MKTICTIIGLLVPICCFSQQDTIGLNLPLIEGKVVYESVVLAPDKSSAELYKNAKQWFVDYFNSSKAVIQSEDKSEGRIAGKGIVVVDWKTSGIIVKYNNRLTIQLDVKEGRYRYRFYDMILSTEAVDLNGFGHLKAREFTPEDLIGNLTGAKNKVLTKSGSRKTLEAINQKVKTMAESLNKAMASRADSF